MSTFELQEFDNTNETKIKAIGVGGAGGNMINRIINEYSFLDIDLIVANTDAQDLKKSNANTKIQLGEKLTRGLGAGMKPEIGKAAAEETYEELKGVLSGTDITFIAAGLGGGTGSGAAPVVARAAKEVGSLTVSVVTLPFSFEGKKRMKLAVEGLEEIKKECDSVLVISNEKLRSVMDKNASLSDGFRMVDSVLARAVGGMSAVILDCGDMNVDFADVKTAMSHRGVAIMGMGSATGEGSAREAVNGAIQSPLLGDINIQGAQGIIIHFRHHPSLPMGEIWDAMDIIRSESSDDADIIYGVTFDDNFEENRVEVTLIATGIENKEAKPETPAKNEDESQMDRIQMFKKVSGGNVYTEDMDSEPAYKRRQMD